MGDVWPVPLFIDTQKIAMLYSKQSNTPSIVLPVLLNHKPMQGIIPMNYRSSRSYSLIVLVFLCLALLSNCGTLSKPAFTCTDAIGCVNIAPGEPVKLGVIQALSGESASIGKSQVNVIELALAARNNTFMGHPIQTQAEDDLCTTEGGANAALKVLNDPQALAILGATCSNASGAVSQMMSKAGLVMLASTSLAPALTYENGAVGKDWYPGFFRVVYNGVVRSEAAAGFIVSELKTTDAASLNDGELYSTSSVDSFNRKFKELGGKTVFDAAINKGDTDMVPILKAVVDSGAKALFLPVLSPEADLVVQQAKKVPGMEQVVIIAGTGLFTNKFLNAIGADGEGVYVMSPAPYGTAGYATMIKDYQAKYGEKPAHINSAYTYDALNLFLDTLQKVAVQDADGTLHIGRQALRDALYATDKYEGITGVLTCTEYGDCSGTNIVVTRIGADTKTIDDLIKNIVYTYKHK